MLKLYNKYIEYKKNNLLRTLTPFTKNKTFIDFTTNDYLNLSENNNLKKAIINGFNKYGFGSKGSNIICGYTDETKQFEQEFANFIGYPKAIFFNSGFMANLAIYSTLFNRHDTIFADKYVHSSIINGIKLSKAKFKRYKHQELNHLKNIYDNNSFITTEGIFSTFGTITKLNLITKITNKLIIDEAHSFGILGENGRGILNQYKINNKYCPISIFPLGKAFGGVGAIICTNKTIANYLIQFANNYIYTTALPPLILTASIVQLKNLIQANNNRVKLYYNILFFNRLSNEKKLKLISKNLSPIKSILVDNNNLLLKLKNKLYKNKILVSIFRYPTVPKKYSILRFSLHSNNTFNEIEQALNIISKEVNNGQYIQ